MSPARPAARRWEPAEEKRQENEHEHDQDTTAYQALAKVGSEEQGKCRHALANEFQRLAAICSSSRTSDDPVVLFH